MKFVVTSFNVGIQGGKELNDSGAVKTELFFSENDSENGKSIILENNILCLQEVGPNFGDLDTSKYENINNISNHIKKGKQLRIVFDPLEFKFVQTFKTNIRIQIVKLQHIKSENKFIIVNCHFGQIGKVNSNQELDILKSFISKINIMEYPIIVAGDFNRSKKFIKQDILKYSNKENLLTTNSKCIDHIMYHSSFYEEISCKVINNLSNKKLKFEINHNALRSQFSIIKEFTNNILIEEIQNIYESSFLSNNYKAQWENDYKNQLKIENNKNINKNKTNLKNKKNYNKRETESESESENIKNQNNEGNNKNNYDNQGQSTGEDKTKLYKKILDEIWKKKYNKKLNISGLYRELNDNSFTYDQLYYFINNNPKNHICKNSITEYLKKHKRNL
ncbi:hypothetical protein ACTFIZ_004803 [Dictyostelium cf. discoideum]